MRVQGVGAGLSGDGVLFVERSSELLIQRKLKAQTAGGVVKASVKYAKLVRISRPETE